MSDIEKQLRALINSESVENNSNTPDWILSSFLMDSLKTLETAINLRDKWYGIKPEPGKDADLALLNAENKAKDTKGLRDEIEIEILEEENEALKAENEGLKARRDKARELLGEVEVEEYARVDCRCFSRSLIKMFLYYCLCTWY